MATDEGRQKNRGTRKRRGRSATLAVEGKGGVTIRIGDGCDVTMDTLSTMKSMRELINEVVQGEV